MVRKHRALARIHGPQTDTTVQTNTATLREGLFEFQDGTQVSYRAEILQNGDLKATIDGETFQFQGGSA